MINRRYIVDVEMGTVIGQIDFGGEKGLPDAHTFRLENGKLRFVRRSTDRRQHCPDGRVQPASNRGARAACAAISGSEDRR